MRAALGRAVSDAARRVAQGSESKTQRWRDEVGGSYASGEAALLREGQRLADAVSSGLELFVGTGMLLRGGASGHDDDAADDEEEDEDDMDGGGGGGGLGGAGGGNDSGGLTSLVEWRRERDLQSDRFAVDVAAAPAAAGSPSSSLPSSAGARQLLRKTHALALEGYVAWVEYASAVLLSNAFGTQRASCAIREALDPSRRRFEELVCAQTSKARGLGGAGAAGAVA
jgi:hypothetical protein